MKDRLEELRAQKKLLQSHLDWLDAEIVREEIHRGTQSIDPPPASTTPRPPGNPATLSTAAAPAQPVTLPETPEIDHKALKHEVRRGCLIYLTIFAAVGLALAGIVYFLYRS